MLVRCVQRSHTIGLRRAISQFFPRPTCTTVAYMFRSVYLPRPIAPSILGLLHDSAEERLEGCRMIECLQTLAKPASPFARNTAVLLRLIDQVSLVRI